MSYGYHRIAAALAWLSTYSLCWMSVTVSSLLRSDSIWVYRHTTALTVCHGRVNAPYWCDSNLQIHVLPCFHQHQDLHSFQQDKVGAHTVRVLKRILANKICLLPWWATVSRFVIHRKLLHYLGENLSCHRLRTWGNKGPSCCMSRILGTLSVALSVQSGDCFGFLHQKLCMWNSTPTVRFGFG